MKKQKHLIKGKKTCMCIMLMETKSIQQTDKDIFGKMSDEVLSNNFNIRYDQICQFRKEDLSKKNRDNGRIQNHETIV